MSLSRHSSFVEVGTWRRGALRGGERGSCAPQDGGVEWGLVPLYPLEKQGQQAVERHDGEAREEN